jgi:hypothetical protein
MSLHVRFITANIKIWIEGWAECSDSSDEKSLCNRMNQEDND